ncbi:homeobox-leucine zipper protein HDG11, partial [Tanacetum coccineum]
EDWSFDFPHIVAKDETIRVLSPGKSDLTSDGTLLLLRKELQATSPCMAAKRRFTLLRMCIQIDQGTWVVAEISHCPSSNNNIRRLPSGCLIQSIAEDLSKVTWVEHMEVEESLPNQTFYDPLIRNGFAFGAERMVAWLERNCERGSHMNVTCDMITKTPGVEGKGYVLILLQKKSSKKYSTGGDCRNNVSASTIEGSSDEILIKEVDVNQTGSLVMWSTVSKKDFDLIRNGGWFSYYIERVKEALEKPRPPSPSRGYWQQVGAYDIASEYRQDELRVLRIK